jgi:hypothetical protein
MNTKISHLDENRRASVNRLFQIFREEMTTIPSIRLWQYLSNIKFLPDLDNRMMRIDCDEAEEWDIPTLLQFMASSRADGQQRVIRMAFGFRKFPVARKLLDAIKEV